MNKKYKQKKPLDTSFIHLFNLLSEWVSERATEWVIEVFGS